MKAKLLLFLILLFSVFTFVYSYTKNNREIRLAYIDTKQVFDNFEYTKILRKEFESTTLLWKTKIDSLNFENRVIENKIFSSNNDEITSVLNNRSFEINNKISEYQQAFENLSNKYDNQILIQLNSYLEEFGKNQNFDMIFGTENLGNLIYSKEHHNVTDKAIEFVNNRFNPSNK